MEKQIRNQWEINAPAFAKLIGGKGTPHHRLILNPCVESLLGNVEGKRLLDAGCGEGYLSRAYADKGASVVGVDISPHLIEIGNSLTKEQQDIEYRIGNICNMAEIANDDFDRILCNLVLLNIPCFESALEEFYRVLKKGGFLVFSIVHPAFNFYGPGTWKMGEKDSVTKRRKGLYFKIDNYLEEKAFEKYWKSRDGEKFPEPITFFHRTLSTYFQAIVEAGFKIVAFEEPTPITDDAFFDREHRIPFFAVFKCEKCC